MELYSTIKRMILNYKIKNLKNIVDHRDLTMTERINLHSYLTMRDAKISLLADLKNFLSRFKEEEIKAPSIRSVVTPYVPERITYRRISEAEAREKLLNNSNKIGALFSDEEGNVIPYPEGIDTIEDLNATLSSNYSDYKFTFLIELIKE